MNVTRRGLLTLGGAAAVATVAGVQATAQAGEETATALIGTYDQGILDAARDGATGSLIIAGASTALDAPSWLTYGPDRTTVYAISEQQDGTVSALDPGLTVRNTVRTGDGPAHVTVHPSGAFLFTSLYGGGATVTHPIDPGGTVGTATDTRDQGDGSHAHQVVIDPAGAYVLSVDLGRDAVFTYTLDPATGRLSLAYRSAMTPGSGPRHLVFHPGGTYAYLANENSSTVTVCTWSDGVLTPVQTLPASTDTSVTNYPGEIVVSPDGRFVYVTNRGANTVATFATTGVGSALTPLSATACGGDWPRHLALEPATNVLYVANQRSGTVTWLPADPATGVPARPAGSVPAAGAAHILL